MMDEEAEGHLLTDYYFPIGTPGTVYGGEQVN